jgi:hypothetical protein
MLIALPLARGVGRAIFLFVAPCCALLRCERCVNERSIVKEHDCSLIRRDCTDVMRDLQSRTLFIQMSSESEM